MTRPYELHQGDALEVLPTLPGSSARTCVTSPPYWGLRDYGVEGQLGLEATPHEYVARMVNIFREVRRVLTDDGTLWLNLGDSYADKNLVGIPWRVAFALQADGWYLRSDVIWHKTNPMPESIKDRPTKAHEYIFLLAKSDRYYYDLEAIREDPKPHNKAAIGRPQWSPQYGPDRIRGTKSQTVKVYAEVKGANKPTVWSVQTAPYPDAHFATFPPDLIRPCILAGSEPGDTILDPFNGSGTTGVVALQHDRKYIGIELNPDYIELTEPRLAALYEQPQLFAQAETEAA